MCQICYNDYDGLQTLNIISCQNIIEIPYINGLQKLQINNCQNISEIPNINGLHTLWINNCQNISEIPNINGLQEFHNNYINIDIKKYNAQQKIKKMV